MIERFSVLLLGLVLLSACGAPGSGDGWAYKARAVDADRVPGEIGPTPRNDRLQVVVASGSGGERECDLPEFSGMNVPVDGQISIGFEWPGRGCADVGGVVFEFVLDGIPFEGQSIRFPVDAESGECVEALLVPGYRVRDITIVDC